MSTSFRVLCYHIGAKVTRASVEAHKLFWTANYAWNLQTDFYRWGIDGHTGQDYVCRIACPRARRLGRYVHCRGGRALMNSNFEQLQNNEERITVGVFRKMACQFNKLFQGLPTNLRPFFEYKEDDGGRINQPAYRMYPGRTYLVIVGVAPGQGLTNDDMDWTLFDGPPDHDGT